MVMSNDSYSLIVLFFTLLLGVVVCWLLLLILPKTHNTTFSRPVTMPPSKYQDCVCRDCGLTWSESTGGIYCPRWEPENIPE